MTEKQKEELLSAASRVSPGGVIKIPNGVSVKEAVKVLSAVNAISCKGNKGGLLIKTVDSLNVKDSQALKSEVEGSAFDVTGNEPVRGLQLELKPFTITSTVKLSATDTRAAILKASQLLAEVANGTPYEFEELSVKVE